MEQLDISTEPGPRPKYKRESMQQAMNSVRDGMAPTDAARLHGVHIRTLRRHLIKPPDHSYRDHRLEKLSEALESVRRGTSVKAACRKHGVVSRTLRRYRDAQMTQLGDAYRIGASRVLPDDIEEEIYKFVKFMDGHDLTTVDLKCFAYELVEKKQIDHRFDRSVKMADDEWMMNFISRHRDLTVKKDGENSYVIRS